MYLLCIFCHDTGKNNNNNNSGKQCWRWRQRWPSSQEKKKKEAKHTQQQHRDSKQWDWLRKREKEVFLKKRWEGIYCEIVHDNVRDRGRFWSFHCCNHAYIAHYCCWMDRPSIALSTINTTQKDKKKKQSIFRYCHWFCFIIRDRSYRFINPYLQCTTPRARERAHGFQKCFRRKWLHFIVLIRIITRNYEQIFTI